MSQNDKQGMGQELRKARLRRKLTVSQVAGATRIKAQIIEDLEREDFSRIAAPIYGKGFLKLYAEHVGIDPAPLIDEYMSHFASQGQSSHPGVFRTMAKSGATPYEAKQPDGSGSAPAGRMPSERTSPFAGTLSAHQEQTASETEDKQATDEMDLFSLARKSAAPAEAGASANAGDKGTTSADINTKKTLKSALFGTLAEVTDAANRLLQRAVTAIRGKILHIAGFGRKCAAAMPGLPQTVSSFKFTAMGLAALLILIFLLLSISRRISASRDETAGSMPASPEKLRVAIEPPDSYLD